MTRSQLIAKIAEDNPHMTAADAQRIVNAFFGAITDALAEGQRVELRDFGSFTPTQLPPRKRRNPQTGETVTAPESAKIRFKSGKALRDRLNSPP